uniref:Uncharacterized protein n=1 Tax=Cacopsylla melanoneura TaxID=428564 RepID=A0A8D8ZFP6_9HEMI
MDTRPFSAGTEFMMNSTSHFSRRLFPIFVSTCVSSSTLARPFLFLSNTLKAFISLCCFSSMSSAAILARSSFSRLSSCSVWSVLLSKVSRSSQADSAASDSFHSCSSSDGISSIPDFISAFSASSSSATFLA